jgi:hypothetical protein
MSSPPKGKPDRTTVVVAGGLVVLAVVGVASIFSGPLMALVAPSSAADITPAETSSGMPDGGAARALPGVGLADAAAHS